MPLLENLVAGLSDAAGSSGGDRIRKRQDDRKQLSDEERKANLGLYNKAIENIQTHMGTVDPNSPQYKTLSTALQKAVSARTELFHPSEGSNNFRHIAESLRLVKKKPLPANAGDARQGLQDAMLAGTQFPDTSSPDYGLSDEDKKKRNRIAGGLDPRAINDKTETENWQTVNVKTADGKEITLQHNTKDGRWTDLAGKDVPEDVLSTATIAPKVGKDKFAWTKKDGKYVSVKLDANNQIIPGTENPNLAPPAYLTGRISTGNFHYVDDKGQVHQVEETRRSVPAGQGEGSGVPKTPREAKEAVKKTAPSKDNVIGFKGTKDYIDTKAAYQAAIDRTSTMEQNLKNARNGDQQAMLSLVANHIGMTLGTQKGARITRAVWDEAISSTPWLSKIAAKWSSDGYLSGVTLAPEQMNQMVRLAHEKTQTLKEHIERLDKERGATSEGGDDMITVQIPGQKPGKIHSSQKDAFLRKYPNATVQ